MCCATQVFALFSPQFSLKLFIIIHSYLAINESVVFNDEQDLQQAYLLPNVTAKIYCHDISAKTTKMKYLN